jgi:hypothetical protein
VTWYTPGAKKQNRGGRLVRKVGASSNGKLEARIPELVAG